MAEIDNGGVITIIELEGEFRSIVLDSTRMPPDLTLAGDLRAITTYYPGNSKASVQIMGTKEDDITIEGWLKDVWTGIAGSAEEAFRRMREVWLGQRYCEFSWGDYIRRGYVRRVEGLIVRRADIQYKIVFAVAEADEVEVIGLVPAKAPQALDLHAQLQTMQLRLNGLNLAIDGLNVISGIL